MDKQTPLEQFVNSRKDWEDKHIQLSILYELKQISEKSEKTRSNTSTLVWWLIAIPFLFAMLTFFSCSDNDNNGCPCETIREYTIENCNDIDYTNASDSQLQAAEDRSNCN